MVCKRKSLVVCFYGTTVSIVVNYRRESERGFRDQTNDCLRFPYRILDKDKDIPCTYQFVVRSRRITVVVLL